MRGGVYFEEQFGQEAPEARHRAQQLCDACIHIAGSMSSIGVLCNIVLAQVRKFYPLLLSVSSASGPMPLRVPK